MARVTTESIESKTKVKGNFEVFDLFFILAYISVSYALMGTLVHQKLQPFFMLFSALMAGFLTWRSSFNKKRRNFESLYFLITRDVAVYLPFFTSEDKDG